MDKTNQAMVMIIASAHMEKPSEFYKTLKDLLFNDLFGLMGDEWTMTNVEEDKWHINGVLHDLSLLMTGEVIEHRHAKTILHDAWATEPYAWDMCWYLSDTKILEEASVDELDTIILELLKDHDKIVKDIKNGKTKAAGSLIGPIMRATGGKANPKELTDRILKLVNK